MSNSFCSKSGCPILSSNSFFILLSQHYLRGDELLEVEHQRLAEEVETWRERLGSVSWFMRCPSTSASPG